ncbi:MAG: GNAT family N-acetyltransferase [Desulfobacterales bacterium]
MIDAANYHKIETLKNGTAFRVRSVRPEDKNRISEAFRNLEAESIYTRFFQHKKALTDKELKAATEVDFETVVALVVTVGEGETETIIAGGRYAAFDAANNVRSAEVSFTVEEDYHGQGIASHLLRHLGHIAQAKGVSQFEAEVLPENKAMLTVFSRSGLPMKKKPEGGTMHVTLSLAGTVD